MKKKIISFLAALTIMFSSVSYTQTVGISIVQNNPSTCAEDGSFVIAPTGLSSGYTYSWDFISWPLAYTGTTSIQTTNTFSNLASGTYEMELSYLSSGNPVQKDTFSIIVLRQVYVSISSATGTLDANGDFPVTPSLFLTSTVPSCVGTTIVSPTTVSCSGGYTQQITLTITETDGKVHIETPSVTLVDTTSPTMVAQNVTVNLDATGNASITISDIDNGSFDNCSLITLGLSQATFDCTDIGQNTITLTGTDGSGNTSSTTSTVTIRDLLAPTIVTKDITVNLDASNNASITISDIDNGSFDNCSLITLGLSQATFDCTDIGQNTITLTGTDGSGNTSSTTSTVTIRDLLAPTIVTKDITVNLDASNNATITVSDIDNGSFDNCSSLITLNLSKTSFTCADVGLNQVILSGTDSTGNIGFATTNVIVVDNLAPLAICKPVTISLNPSGIATLTTADVNNGSSDNCSVNLSLSQSTFNCSYLGVNAITLLVTDSQGLISTCSTTVTVVDNILPTMTCKSIVLNLDATGNATITASDIDNGSADNCSLVTLSLSKTTFNCSNIGSNTVVLTGTDVSGNTSSCSASVTVVDNTPPIMACKPITLNLDATGNATITASDIDNGSGDNCSLASLSLSKTTFNCSNIGQNTVILTGTDASGNPSTCATTVTVVDNILPTMTCKSIVLNLDATGNATITASDIDNGSADNCSLVTLSLSKTTFNCSNIGSNTVILTGTDASGNTSSCSAPVIVVDTSSPNIATISASLSTICLGASSTLTTNSGLGYTYSWSNGATIIGTSQNITVSPNSTTTYSVTLSSISGCSSITASKTIIVTPIIQATISGLSAVCIGDSATLTANSGTSYLWSNGATTQSITVNPSSSTSYSVSVVNSGCSSNSSVSNVIVNPLPTVNAGNDQTICEGTPTTLSANLGSGYSYYWSNGTFIGNTQSITVNPNITSTYAIRVTDPNGCRNSDQVTVNVTQLPNSQIFGEDSVCKNSYHNLYSINSSNNNLVDWSISNGEKQGLDGSSKKYLVHWYDNTLPAYITAKETVNGSTCYKYDTLFVTLINLSALDPTTINPIHPGSKILVAANSYPEMNWGYEAKNSGTMIYVNGHNQYYEYAFIDTINFYYWVEIGDNNSCLTKSYYNPYVYYLNLKEKSNPINALNIYPNPVQDKIFIQGVDNKYLIKVLDQTGRLINELSILNNTENSIDVSSYSPGIYYLVFKTTNSLTTHKFIKIP